MDELLLVRQVRRLVDREVRDQHAGLTQLDQLGKRRLVAVVPDRVGRHDDLVLADGQVVEDFVGRFHVLVDQDLLVLFIAVDVAVHEAQDARLGVELLHQFQHELGAHGAGAGQVVEHELQLHQSALLFGVERHAADLAARLPEHGVADTADLAEPHTSFVSHPIEAGRDLVRLDLLGRGRAARVLQHEARLGPHHLQLVSRHVDQRAGLEHPAGVGRSVDHVQLLRRGLVQQILRRNEVGHEAKRSSTPEVREERDDGETAVRRPVVVQRHVQRRHGPSHLAHRAPVYHQLPLLRERVALRLVPCHGNLALVADHRIDEVVALLQLVVLPVDDADPLDVLVAVVLLLQAFALDVLVVVLRERRGLPDDEVRAVPVLGRLRTVEFAELIGLVSAVQHLDLVGRQPAGHTDFIPGLRVVLLGARIQEHAAGIQHRLADFTEDVVVVADPDVEVPPLFDQAVENDLGFVPVGLVVLLYVVENPGEELRSLGGGCTRHRLDDNLLPV